PLSVGIPVDYISDQNLRLSLYRRIADINDETEVTSMEDEFQDRFGELPEAVKNLMFQIRVKLLAEQIGLSTVNLEGSQIVLRFPPLPEGVQARDLPFINKEVRSGKNAYWLAFHPENEKWKSNLLQILSDIINVCRKY
ncbi:MAG: TRCF domain-containing protein, partial [Anaerolineaceae bacterium]